MSARCLELALATFREPARLGEFRDRALPDDILEVIRAASADSQLLDDAAAQLDAPPETVREAAVFFLQQLLFAPGADAYRVLGASSDAPQERLRENYRWLMKWLHPDRNQDGWEVVYADRVNAAWQDLKTPDRRAEYDKRVPAPVQQPPTNFVAPRPVAVRSSHAQGPMLSGNTVRRLPALIFGSLAVVAAAVLGLMYWAQADTERELARRNAAVASSDSQATSDTLDDLDEIAAASAPAPQDQSPTNNEPPLSEPPEPMPDAPGTELSSSESLAAAPPPAEPTPSVPASDPEPIVQPSTNIAPAPIAASASPPAAAVPSEPVPEPAPAVVAPTPPVKSMEIVAPAVATLAEHRVAATPSAPTAEPTPAEPTPIPAARVAIEASAPPVARPAPVQLERPPAAPVPVPPEPAPEVVSVPPPAVEPPSASSVQAILKELASAYSSGNQQRFDRLFARPAGGAITAMRQRMMAAEMRFLELGSAAIHNDRGQAIAELSFRDTYVPKGQKRAVTESGRMRVSMTLLDGAARIADVSRLPAR